MFSIRNRISFLSIGTIFLFVVIFLLAHHLFAFEITDSNKIVFGDIQIIRLDIFDTVGGRLKWFQELTNKLHIQSRHLVINREILFTPGEPFRIDLLKETERNLRQYQFLGRVTVTADQSNPFRKNTTILTQDQWSTVLEFSAGREGGRNHIKTGLAEQNFLGLGQHISIKYVILSTGNFVATKFDETRLLNTRWALHLQKIQGADRNFFIGELVRPLFSLDSRWSAGFSITNGSAKSRIYENSDESDAFRSEGTILESFLVHSFGSRYKKTNLRFEYGFTEANFTPYWFTRNLKYITPDDRYHYVGIGLEKDSFSYVEEYQLDRFLRVEDIKLGTRWYGEIDLARRMPSPKRHRLVQFLQIKFENNLSLKLPWHQYFFSEGNISSRMESGNFRHTITKLNFRYYNKILPHQTIVSNIVGVYGQKLDPGWQYTLGEDNGLRGYESFRFAGQKLFLMNFEDRIFTPWQVLWTGIGAAVFVDGGYVWKSVEPVRFRDLRFSIGVGLRLSLNKSAGSRVVRFDFAKPINGNGYLISIANDHIFLVNPIKEIFRFPGMVF